MLPVVGGGRAERVGVVRTVRVAAVRVGVGRRVRGVVLVRAGVLRGEQAEFYGSGEGFGVPVAATIECAAVGFDGDGVDLGFVEVESLVFSGVFAFPFGLGEGLVEVGAAHVDNSRARLIAEYLRVDDFVGRDGGAAERGSVVWIAAGLG
ncbi:hypothetical protein ACFXG4_48500 [Nocardia sp. NPDC059246]|uniref:hypothetical protein n=1 Tax=unclassified Nocardia TaxID=2637762 RepID=UPI0036965B51